MSKLKVLPKAITQRETAAELLQRIAADEVWQSMDEIVVVALRMSEESVDWTYTATAPVHLHPALIRSALQMSEERAEGEAVQELMQLQEAARRNAK